MPMLSAGAVPILVAAMLAPAATHRPLAIVSVVVTESGQPQPQDAGIDPPGRCRPYRPTGRQVLRWFKAARRVSPPAWIEADRSQCWAKGTLRTADGHRYRWELDQAGLGTVALSPTASEYFVGRKLPFRIGL